MHKQTTTKVKPLSLSFLGSNNLKRYPALVLVVLVEGYLNNSRIDSNI